MRLILSSLVPTEATTPVNNQETATKGVEKSTQSQKFYLEEHKPSQEPKNESFPEPFILNEHHQQLAGKVQLESSKLLMPVVGQTVLCPDTNSSFSQTCPEPKIYYVQQPQNVTYQKRYITSSFGLTGGIGNMVMLLRRFHRLG